MVLTLAIVLFPLIILAGIKEFFRFSEISSLIPFQVALELCKLFLK